VEREPRIREFLETPRIDIPTKQRALEASFGSRVPDLFLRFLLVVVANRRQALFREIAQQYQLLIDEARGRVHAEILVAREADESLKREIEASLERRLGKDVIPTFRVDPSLIGGIVIRIGGQVLDGSLRRRTAALRRRLLHSRLPELSET
jgi:F-type H+-transporting ATPase subunit delta